MSPPTLRAARRRQRILEALDSIGELADHAFRFKIRSSAWRPVRPFDLERRHGGIV